MLKKILVGLVVIIGGFLIYVGLQSGDYKITRQILINAPAAKIYPFIASTKLTNEWMPWKDMDAQVKISYSGTESGVGSISIWESPGQMGVGSAEVTDAVENQKIITKITYTKPMEFHQMSEFLLTPQEQGTMMTWTVTGKNNFLSRIVCSFMNMDKYVGGMFEQGLKKLKPMVEGA